MRQPKSLEKALFHPQIVTLFLFGLMTLLTFHLGLRSFVYRSAEEEARQTLDTFHTFLRSASDENLERAPFRTLLGSLGRVNRLTKNTQLYLVGPRERKALSPEESPYGQALVRLLDKSQEEAARTGLLILRTDEGRFLGGIRPLPGPGEEQAMALALITSLEETDRFIARITQLLFLLFLLATALASIFVKKKAQSLCADLRDVSKHARSLASPERTYSPRPAATLETQELHKTLDQLARDLGANERAQRTFFASVSHDIRTPLQSIGGYAEGIQAGVFKDPIEPARIIAEESRKLDRSLDQLITLSRLDGLTKGPSPEPVDLLAFLENLLRNHRGLALSEKKTLVLEPFAPLVLSTDPDSLEKILSNFLANALRYAQTKVEVWVKVKEKTLVIGVDDDGGGIDKAILPSLFDMHKKGPGGQHGLGLYIAQRAAHWIGARLEARNTENGARLTCTLFFDHAKKDR